MENGRAKDAKTEATAPWMIDFCLKWFQVL
jgi:hypothetical protein